MANDMNTTANETGLRAFLKNIAARLRAAATAEPVPFWTDYLHGDTDETETKCRLPAHYI